jgi:hypothetical protein
MLPLVTLFVILVSLEGRDVTAAVVSLRAVRPWRRGDTSLNLSRQFENPKVVIGYN